MRRPFLQTLALALATLASSWAWAQSPAAGAEWPSYAGDKASTKYSPLSQIDGSNFSRLKVAWTWRSPEEAVTRTHPSIKSWTWESTPLMVGGTLYITTSLSQAAAIDAATGRTKWVYDPETWKNGTPSNNGFVHRGVAYWADGEDKRILFGTGDGYLIALSADTGKPIGSFGRGGRIDLTQGLGRKVDRKLYGVSSPPIVSHDLVVMGSKVNDVPLAKAMPPGSVRGFDVRTGKQRWIFHTIPQPGEYGYETWEKDAWKTFGAANVWTMVSADDALGLVYLPVSTPSDDHYGVRRPGDGLFGESLVALDVRTGKRAWSYQLVHHGLWDYDPPSAPNLVDVTVDGKPVRALVQVSKQGFAYVLDRVTGKPVWPIVERPVPPSTVPGEKTSATQPFPTRPAAFDRQGATLDNVTDLTPELRQRALAILERYNHGPLFTPMSLEKPTIEMPGTAGGASWSGAAFDPETKTLYVSSITMPQVKTLVRSKVPGVAYEGELKPLETMDGIPLWKPPYGRVTAIDLNTGEERWMAPVGDLAQSVPALKALNLPPLGRPARGHLLLTKTLLIVGQEGTTQRENGSATSRFEVHEPKLSAFDKATGKLLGEVALPRNATGAPMTFELGGKQYIAVPTGGANLPAELIVLSLP